MDDHSRKNKHNRIMMILCCAIPILIVGALYLTKVQSTPWGSVLSFGAILLCPLMHLVMMPLMLKGKKSEGTGEDKSGCH